jgi:uncharacterized protein DUF87
MIERVLTSRSARRDPTLIGRVRHVMGSTVTVELLEEIAGSAPLYEGRVYHVGQIGSLVTLPQGPIRLIAAVTMLGISELTTPPEPAMVPQQGERWLKVQLLGELDALGKFQRGVSIFPSLDDEVRFATSQELDAMFPPESEGYIAIGGLSTSRGHILRLNLAKLVARHTAVLGSTGSGKSSTVARIIQSVLLHGFERANIVIIDPHGEYSAAFDENASVMSFDGEGAAALSIPYWSLGLDDVLRAYMGGGSVNPNTRSKVSELILAERKEFLQASGWSAPSPDDITVDTPIPYDIREVWYKLDFLNRAIARGSKASDDYAEKTPGNAKALVRAEFEPYGTGGRFQNTFYGQYSPLPDRMVVRLKDPRFRFLSRDFPDPAAPDPLPDCLARWLGGNRPISVLNFSGVPSEAADVAIGAVLNLLFEITVACPADKGIGRARPVLIVIEEAHRFIGEKVSDTAGAAKNASERIAREGRKYGLGLMVVSQRPAELSETALSQCGTFISMRLTNPGDQNRIKSALPDTVANLAEALPSLRTGEALITGEAITLPSRVLIDRPQPEPSATDPALDTWFGSPADNDVVEAVARWRGIQDDGG